MQRNLRLHHSPIMTQGLIQDFRQLVSPCQAVLFAALIAFNALPSVAGFIILPGSLALHAHARPAFRYKLVPHT